MRSFQKGNSILEVVVGLSAIGLLILGVSRFLSVSGSGLNYMALKGQAEDVRNTIRIEFDCATTLTQIGNSCNGVSAPQTTFVKLLRKDGSTLVPKFPNETNNSQTFSLRASCRETTETLQFHIDAKQNAPASNSRTLAGTLFADWKDFFKGVPLVCRKSNVAVDLNLGYCIERKRNQFCPAGYAAFGFTDPTRSHTSRVIDTWAYCCRVPSDLLTTDHTFVNTTCPSESVVTGGTTSQGEGVVPCETFGAECRMRCTRINTARYKLGPQQRGDFWTDPQCPCAAGGGGAIWRDRNTLPLAMRFGTGRQSLLEEGPNQYLQTFDLSACIPSGLVQTGGLMVKKTSKQCGDFYGVQVLYTGALAGDPVNVPVQLLPRCSGSVDRIVQGQERYRNFICQ